MKKRLKVPKFKDEDEERAFWDKTDFGDYIVRLGAQQLRRFSSDDLASYKLTQWEIQDKLLNGYIQQS